MLFDSSLMFLLFFISTIFTGFMSFILWLNEFGRTALIIFVVSFFICVGGMLYYYPLQIEEHSYNNNLELSFEKQLDNSDCKTIKQYVIDTLDVTNKTTAHAKKLLIVKCNGVPTP
jgi:hypothetical protein